MPDATEFGTLTKRLPADCAQPRSVLEVFGSTFQTRALQADSDAFWTRCEISVEALEVAASGLIESRGYQPLQTSMSPRNHAMTSMLRSQAPNTTGGARERRCGPVTPRGEWNVG